MSARLTHFALADATTDEGARTLSGLAVPWNVTTNKLGMDVVFTADTLRVPDQLDTVKLLVQHDDERPVGYATAAAYDDDGLRMTFALADHPRADALLTETDTLLRDGLSVGVELDSEVYDEAIARLWGEAADDDPLVMAGVVREVSAVSIPAFNDARLNQAAGLVRFTHQEVPMPTTALPAPPVETPPDPAPTFSLEELAAKLAPILDAQRKDPHRFAAFLSLADYYDQAFDGRVEPFALVDQITTDNPGVVPPSWLSEIQGIIAVDRPAITALGTTPAPAAGMTVNWPYYDGDIKTLVGQQLTEKTEITSVKVSFKKGTVDLKTYAGGSDISYQLLKRSSPEYRAAYMELLLSGYNYVTDAAFVTAVIAAATAGTATWDPAAGTASQLRAALFTASLAVRRATGQPASVVLAGDDVFLAIAALDGLYPAPYGTQNVSGTVDASTLEIRVAGLPPIVNDPFMDPDTLLVTNGRAAKWIEDGPYTATAEDVAKLGQDNAIWGMGAPGVFSPKGVISVGPGVAPGGLTSPDVTPDTDDQAPADEPPATTRKR